MTRITDRDLLLYAGGAALVKYGTLVRRTRPPVYGGEELVETYTRSGTSRAGTTAAGLILPFSDDRIPVWHWNPFTGAATPYPIPVFEPGRTNLLLQSADFATTWSNVASSESVNQDISPEATTTVDRIIEDGTTGAHGVSQDVTITADAIHAFSVWVRKDSTRGIVALQLANTAFTNTVVAWFTLSAGSVSNTATTGSGSHVASYVEDWGTLYRIVLVGSIGGGSTTLRCRVLGAATTGSTSYTGDAASYLSLWGAQCEAGYYATSYIPTTTTTATRGVGAPTVLYQSQVADFTAYLRFTELGAVLSTVSGRVLEFGSNADPRLIVHAQGSGFYRASVDGGTIRTSTLPDAPTVGDEVELRAILTDNFQVNIAQSVNGAPETSGTLSVATEAFTAFSTPKITLGADGSGGNQAAIALSACIVARGTGFSMDDFRALLP